MQQIIYPTLLSQKQQGSKALAVLIDPDKSSVQHIDQLANLATTAGVDYFFVGGSLMVSNNLDACIHAIKKRCAIPVILFPGAPAQISSSADALLYLSLISGRNAELLIGQHVLSAPTVKRSGLEILPTGYMVIDGGAPTTVSYISGAAPIPANKPDIALCTALAGEMLGLKIIYLDAGSGAKKAVSEEMVATIATQISVPLFVGGGIRNAEKAYALCNAGADVVVAGNILEKDPELVKDMAAAVHAASDKNMVQSE